MSDLQPEYDGRITFNIIPVNAEGADKEIHKHKLGTHGLVVYAADGTVSTTIPGHNFERKEVEAAIAKVLE